MNDYTNNIKTDHEADNLSDKFENEIRDSYNDLSDKLPLPPSNAFSRIMDTINTEEEQQKNRTGQSLFSIIFSFINDHIITKKIGWAMTGIQLAIIILFLISSPMSKTITFKTLSINPVPNKSIEINIIFKEDARQRDITQLLHHSDAIIVNGPTENGLYILKISQGHDLGIRLQTIENSKIVKFAGIRY